MSRHITRIPFALLSLTLAIASAHGQNKLGAKANSYQPSQPSQPTADASNGESDRARDGLFGPVRRVRTEVSKLSNVGGKIVEDSKRLLLETSEYDLKGSKTQNQYFPIAGASLTGREVYKYDEKGNISEMTLINADGSLISKEVYKYEFDSVGNWIKMTTSVAVVENGKIGFEPTEVTYRTIFYYLDASMTKMLEPATNPSSSPASSPSPVANKSAALNSKDSKPASSSVPLNENKTAAVLPPSTSTDKLKGATAQPVATDLKSTSIDASKPVAMVDGDAPPSRPRPLLKPVSGGVLNGMAVSLPAPSYPEVARRMRSEGVVQVEVIVDENGKVISVHVTSGPAMLRDAAVQAAYRARFSPTKLSGQPVKVSGVINYNFVLPK